jgi:hypothetical protein
VSQKQGENVQGVSGGIVNILGGGNLTIPSK